MTVTVSERIGVTRWSADTDPLTRNQFDESHANIESNAARFNSGATDPVLPNTAYARAFFYNTTSSTLKYSDSGTSWQTVAVGTNFATKTGTETLTNKTLTAPVISSITNTGTLTLPTSTDTLVGRKTTDTLTNKTLTEPLLNFPIMTAPEETWSIAGTSFGTTATVNLLNGSAWLWTAAPSGNFTINVRGDGSTTLASLLQLNHSVTVAVGVTNGATAHYMTTFQVDGSAITPSWQGGITPSFGNANSIDVYTFTIVKTAVTPTYTVFASQTKFA